MTLAAALAAHRAGDLPGAEAGYRRILRTVPDHPHANNNLAVLLRAVGRSEEALTFYLAAIRADLGDPVTRANVVPLLLDLGRPAEALAFARSAAALCPDHPNALFNLGGAARDSGDRAGAARAYRRAETTRPGMAEACAALGEMSRSEGRLEEAVGWFVSALRSRPDLIEARVNMGETLREQGRIGEAIAAFQTALRYRPDNALVHSNLLLALHYSPSVSPDVVFRAHVQWGEARARPLATPKHFDRDPHPDRRLRVGYLSPDFRAHSCANFSEPLIREHDRRAVEVFCYMTSKHVDAVTRHFQSLADHWREVAALDDADLARLIEDDAIDILVDLAGHTGGGRLQLFAREPAPLRMTWLGYPDTTGTRAIDYRVTDAVADPPGAEARHSERLIRLPGGFLTYRPLFDPGPPGPPPSLASGRITFGSFNAVSKITPDVVRLWSALLLRVEESRLLLKSAALSDPPTRGRFARLFAAEGIEEGRVEFAGRIEPAVNHLRAYDRMDIALDPFPYNGTTTTCDALWMGVPVATLAGTTHVSRVGASLLTRVGLEGLVATSGETFLETVAAIARDPERLTTLRSELRERMRRSRLGDHAGFARDMEAAFRAAWRERLGG